MPKFVGMDNPVIRLVLVVTIVLFATAGWVWWHEVYMSPRNAFWGALSNSMATPSITRHSNQHNGSNSLDQYSRLQLAGRPTTQTKVVIKQSSGKQFSNITSETIGTADIEYDRYIQIETNATSSSGKQIDPSSVIGVWGVRPADGTDPNSALNKELLGSILFTNLNQKRRQELIGKLKSQNIYMTDFSSVTKASQHGRTVYLYTVKVTPSKFVAFLNQYVAIIGRKDIGGLDPSQYSGAPDTTLKITVDPLSRQILATEYVGATDSETYSGNGVTKTTETPKSAIPFVELQQRLQKIQQ